MSEDPATDMIMYLVMKAGTPPLDAESTLVVVGSERMMTGFSKGKFFEIESFSVGIELEDDEGGEDLDGKEKRSYARWRSLKDATLKPDPPFRANPNEVTVSRRIDKSSPALLKACLETTEFEKAVVVRRARTGQRGQRTAILRIEFKKVWLRNVDWEDGDTVRETCKFKFAEMDITYAKQLRDGSPGATMNTSWKAYEKQATS